MKGAKNGTQCPIHLSALTDMLERVEIEPVRGLVSVPPQHGKTESVMHGIVWLLMRNPQMRIAYVGYNQSFANKKSLALRDIVSRTGLRVREDADARKYFQLMDGGEFVATSVGGELTGLGFDVIVVDDPFANRKDAETVSRRDTVYEWFSSTAMTRLAPGGSVIIVHTRWHEDDLIGRIKRNKDDTDIWEEINLPAINEYGEALWPEQYNLAILQSRRAKSEYDWWSMYMGQPRAKGGELFRDPVRYERPELNNARIIIACDPAATTKTANDFSAAVVLACVGYEEHMRADVLEVLHFQKELPEVCKELEELSRKYCAPIHVEASGVGKAIPQMLRVMHPSLDVRELKTPTDKFIRAQPVSSAWNQGRVRIPMRDEINSKWLDAFISEVGSFTGVGDAHDDQVDALAHAWNAGESAVTTGVGYSPLHEEDYDPLLQRQQEYWEKRLESL